MTNDMPALPDILPEHHPDPRTLHWTRTEVSWIQQYAKDYAAACVAAERERCARVCEQAETDGHINTMRVNGGNLADAIRAKEGA